MNQEDDDVIRDKFDKDKSFYFPVLGDDDYDMADLEDELDILTNKSGRTLPVFYEDRDEDNLYNL